MFLFLLLCMCPTVLARCIWHSPAVMFPKRLVHLEMQREKYVPRRRLASTIYQIGEQDDGNNHVITGATSEKNANLSTGGNAVQNPYSSGDFKVGRDESGRAHYTLVFDKANAVAGKIYSYVAAKPEALFRPVDLSAPGDKIVLANFTHELAQALEYVDVIKVWISVRSACMPEREIARVPYDFNVTASYDLYHSYKNTLTQNVSAVYSTGGWIPQASIIMHPPLFFSTNISQNYLITPCGQAWVDSTLDVQNTSQFTYWDPNEYKFWVSNKFIGHLNRSIPRCHRREHGNVCSVIATARLTYRNCFRPIRWSVTHAVSQIMRHTRIKSTNVPKPLDFDSERRLPIPDHGDMRYDMCEARACQDEHTCVPMHIENRRLMNDSAITIQQHDVLSGDFTNGYIETVCAFEVIGFIDDVWTPHIYFRQWVGYNYTLL